MHILAVLTKTRANTLITIPTPDGPLEVYLRPVTEGIRGRFYDLAKPATGEAMVQARALLLSLVVDAGNVPVFATMDAALKALNEAEMGGPLSLLADRCLEHFNERATPKAEEVSPKAPQPTGDSGQ